MAAFTGIGIRFHEIHFHQRQKSSLQAPRSLEIILQAQANELRHLRRNFVGDHGDQPLPAESDDRQRERVVAREHHESLPASGREWKRSGRCRRRLL